LTNTFCRNNAKGRQKYAELEVKDFFHLPTFLPDADSAICLQNNFGKDSKNLKVLFVRICNSHWEALTVRRSVFWMVLGTASVRIMFQDFIALFSKSRA